MRNVLLITDHFPPEQSGASGRTFSIYKYLPLFGYNVIVLTIPVYGKLADEKNIYRIDSIYDWKKQKIFSKIFKKFISKAFGLFYINYDRYWEKCIFKSITEIIENIDIIYSTYPHSASTIISFKLSRKYKIPLISEFRDGFLFEPVERLNPVQKFSRKIVERKIVNHSNAIITISKNISKYFQEQYNKKEIYTVYNGYDDNDFQFLNSVKEQLSVDKTLIVHYGQINKSRYRSIKPLLIALQRLKKDRSLNSINFELSFIGDYNRKEIESINQYKLNDIIKIYKPVDKIEGLKKIVSMYHFLFLYGVQSETSVITNKIYEYIKLNKPIIAVCKGNEAEEIIKRTGTGEVADFDPDSIYNIFNKYLNKQYKFSPDKEEIKKFNRKDQAKQISEILNSVVNEIR